MRPSRAKPKTGWTLPELARITATRERLLQRWLEMEVVPRPPFRGKATRYERQQLVWVLAARRLQATTPVSLQKIKEQLTAMSGERMETLAREACPTTAAAEALGIAPAASVVARSPNASGLYAVATAQLPTGGLQLPDGSPGAGRWTRFELGLGLELSIRDDASPDMHALAARIRSLRV